MPRPLLGVGPGRARRIAVLRGIGIVIAAALGGVGVWLIVTSSTQKGTELGILAGLWGFLIGAYCAFGSRAQPAPDPPVATMPAFDPEAVQPAAELDVRPRKNAQRKEELAARREFQARLEKILRREVHEGLARELAGLRAEVAALRSELVEKVGGQLRLERIETTRLIGSDIEALHQEVRELKFLQATDEDEPAEVTVRRTIATVPPAAAGPADEDVTDVEFVDDDDDDENVEETVDEPAAAVPVADPEPEPVHRVAAVAPEPEPVPEPAPEYQALRTKTDPFASMPRLSRFVDDAAPVVEERAAAEPTRRAGGRRYREDDSQDNVLARILERERTKS